MDDSGWKNVSFVKFCSAAGREYDLLVGHDQEVVPALLVEDMDGSIRPFGNGFDAHEPRKRWDSLSEMTQDLRVQIISWGSETSN